MSHPQTVQETVQHQLNLGLQAHQEGRLQEAEGHYQAVLSQTPNLPEIRHLVALLYQDQGRLSESKALLESLYQEASPETPLYPAIRQALGNVLCDLGETLSALSHLEWVYQQTPNDPTTAVDLAIVYQHERRFDEAKTLYQTILQHTPNWAEVWNNLGNVHRSLNDIPAAIHAFESALAVQADFIQAYVNLSSLYQDQNDVKKAIPCCLKGLEIAPHNLALLEALAALYYQTGEKDQAAETYTLLLQQHPHHAKSALSLGTIRFEQNLDLDAVAYFQQAIALSPNQEYEEAYSGLGNAYHRLGQFDDAVAAFAKASEIRPAKKLLQWRSQTSCPVIYQNWEEIQQVRTRLQSHLESNLDANFPFDMEELLYSGCEPSFFLTYQGLNDRELKSLYGDVFYGLMSRQHPHLLERPDLRLTQDKIHIGFLVTEKHEGVFCKLNAGYLNHLNSERFNITVITHAGCIPIIQSRLTREGINFLTLEESLLDSAQKIKALDLDVLLVYEVGSDPMNYFLPLLNLAPIQCTSYGMPVTSGLPTMDYFITSQQVETAEAQSHYRETIYPLAWDPIYFYPQTHQMKGFQSRDAYGFKSTDHLMVCPQNLFKFHPDFDEAILSILAQDEHAHILTITSLWDAWQERFKNRLKSNPIATQNPQLLERLHALPRQNHHGYLNLLHISDVMLDTFHYTGGTTSFEGLMMGIPIVTMPYETTRSRQTLGNYHTMGYTDCVAATPEDYVAKVLSLANQGDLNQQVRRDIQAKSPILFENTGVIQEMERFLEWAVQAHQKGNTPFYKRQHPGTGGL